MYITFYLYKPSYLFCYFYLFNDFMIIWSIDWLIHDVWNICKGDIINSERKT